MIALSLTSNSNISSRATYGAQNLSCSIYARIAAVLVLALLAGVARADSLTKVTSASSQGGNDSLSWSQKGVDGTVLAASFTATTTLSTAVTVNLGAANSVLSTVCTASPCSWTGTGFTAGHQLLWTSDAGNGGSGPVTLKFGKSIAGAGALIQADLPGAFTAQIQLFNGSTSLGAFTVASDTTGDPVYIGAIDQTGANITQVVFSLTACASLCSDFGLDTVAVNGAAVSTLTVSLSPTSLAFGSLAVGSTSPAKLVTVKNTGTGTVNLTSETVTAPFLKSATTCGSTLAASATCTVSVEFKPTSATGFTGTLSVADNATGSPQTVTLSGTGTQTTGPTVTLTPTSIAFSPQVLGTTSDAQIVTLKNTGTTTVTISSIALGGTNVTSFLELGGCGTTLAAGASCPLYVAFQPAKAGALSGTVSITDNATGSPQKVTLTGTGTTAPAVKLSVTSLAFGTVKSGTTSAAKVVTITNSGTATLNILGISLAGSSPTSFEELNTCTSTLAGGASCSVYVAFKPKAVGAVSATLTVIDEGSTTKQTVALTGTGN